MYVLIEGYQYNAATVKDVVKGIDALEDVDGMVSINYVGYFYNTLLKDCVCILPKVLLNENDRVFGDYAPEDIINLSPDRKNFSGEGTLLDVERKGNPLKEEEKRFIYEFSVWIYRAINVFKEAFPKSEIVYQKKVSQAGRGHRRKTDTFLDVILALRQFNKENQNFFFFILRNLHSGYNKINWTRTISTTTAIVQDNTPIYLRPVNKKRQINFDEELLIIFFSILNFINEYYGFDEPINCNFNLIKGKQFETYLKGMGRTRLRQIRYKYFSDKALMLWELCYAFFDHAYQIRINSDQQEYLLVKNFNIVFEAIIDELIGDNPLPDGMDKQQEDGKIVDHLYMAKSLIENKDKYTYYIGDSKYYKIGHDVGNESVYKQYTYARNVIQWNIDIFNKGGVSPSGIKLRDDELTEGYNIIPNFFISAKIEKKDGAERPFDYTDDGVDRTNRKDNKHKQIHFPNRLFDRDTLLLFHYDVNFLFVLSLYARNNTLQKRAWKTKMRNMFRQDIQDWLQEDYKFYAMKAHPGVNSEAYIKEHFQELLGKVYTPYADTNIYSLALDSSGKYQKENDDLIESLRNYFYVEECNLGQNPKDVLPKEQTVVHVDKEKEKGELALCVVKQGNRYDATIEKLRSTGKIAIALQDSGAVLKLVEGFTKAKYLIVHNRSGRYEAFYMDGNGPILMPNSPTLNDIPTTKANAEMYLVFDIDKQLRPVFGALEWSVLNAGERLHHPRLINLDYLIKKEEDVKE